MCFNRIYRHLFIYLQRLNKDMCMRQDKQDNGLIGYLCVCMSLINLQREKEKQAFVLNAITYTVLWFMNSVIFFQTFLTGLK